MHKITHVVVEPPPKCVHASVVHYMCLIARGTYCLRQREPALSLVSQNLDHAIHRITCTWREHIGSCKLSSAVKSW